MEQKPRNVRRNFRWKDRTQGRHNIHRGLTHERGETIHDNRQDSSTEYPCFYGAYRVDLPEHSVPPFFLTFLVLPFCFNLLVSWKVPEKILRVSHEAVLRSGESRGG